MQSKTSFFNWTLFKKNLGRYAPLWGIFLGILFLSGPLALLRGFLRDGYEAYNHQANLVDYFEVRNISVVLCNFFLAPLCAGLLFRYLHQARSAYMMHAFPINRSTQFVTNVLTGLCFALIPYLLQTLLNVLICVGLRGQESLWQLLLKELLSYLFFFGLAVFCMLLSGNTIIAVLSYFALNFVFMLLPLLVLYLMRGLCFGLDLTMHEERLLALCPLVQMLRQSFDGSDHTNWLALGIYGGIGLVLLALSWLLYRVRHIEQAGETMAYKWARIAFLLVFTVACTLGLGMLLTVLFSGNGEVRTEVFPSLLIFSVVSSFLGWFGAQMMLKRTVKVFRKRQLLGWVCVAIATLALLCGLRFDAFGIQRFLPKLEKVQEMTLITETNNYGAGDNLRAELTTSDPKLIQTMLDEHRAAYQRFAQNGEDYGWAFTVKYKMKDGSVVTRVIRVQEPASGTLVQAFNTPENAAAYYEKLLPAMFHGEDPFVWIDGEKPYNDGPFDGNSYTSMVANDKNAVKEAMLQDAAEGNLPVILLQDGLKTIWHLSYGSYSISVPDTAVHTLALFKET